MKIHLKQHLTKIAATYFTGLLSAFSLVLLMKCSGAELFPEYIEDCQLVKTNHGKLAGETINNYHEHPIAPGVNDIGYYENDSASISIFVSTFDTPEQAAAAYEKMVIKITPFNSPFNQGKYIYIDGNDVFRYYGIVDYHYVFVREKQVFWMKIKDKQPEKYLETYIRHIF